ncbi:DedA family protein [Nakamurella lactea]|uniref:DedA family protein n=1 Tax=Nakamurella lactea TaxID=459515 RepID=UPI00048F0E48|nr:VTT domain-containing protein [Nakamurella lactea]
MPNWWQGRPLWIAAIILFVIVFARAQGTYWIGRAARSGSLRTRWAPKLTGPRVSSAVRKLNRWGAPLVTVSFLTVGFQTVVNAAAGLTAMRWPRYTLAMVPGCVAWAFIYATVGLAAFDAWLALAARSAWWAWLVAALLAVGVLLLLRRLRRSRGLDSGSVVPEDRSHRPQAENGGN